MILNILLFEIKYCLWHLFVINVLGHMCELHTSTENGTSWLKLTQKSYFCQHLFAYLLSHAMTSLNVA